MNILTQRKQRLIFILEDELFKTGLVRFEDYTNEYALESVSQALQNLSKKGYQLEVFNHTGKPVSLRSEHCTNCKLTTKPAKRYLDKTSECYRLERDIFYNGLAMIKDYKLRKETASVTASKLRRKLLPLNCTIESLKDGKNTVGYKLKKLSGCKF